MCTNEMYVPKKWSITHSFLSQDSRAGVVHSTNKSEIEVQPLRHHYDIGAIT